MAASFLDLFGGGTTKRAAQRLVGFGLLVTAPTAAAGVAECRRPPEGRDGSAWSTLR